MTVRITDKHFDRIPYTPAVTRNYTLNFANSNTKKIESNISDLGRLLSELNVKEKSLKINSNENSLNYSFEISKSKEAKLNFYADVNLEKQQINARMNYEFSMEIEGKKRNFEMNIAFESSDFKQSNETIKVVKEDITDFVQRITKRIMDLAKNKKLNFTGLELSKEDLEDILSYEDNKGRKVLLSLLKLIIQVAAMENASKQKEKNAIDITYNPERRSNIVHESNLTIESIKNLNISLKEIA